MRTVILALILCVVSSAARPSAQSKADFDALKKQIEAIAASQAAMQKQLDEIRTLLKERPAAPAAPAPRPGPAPGSVVSLTGVPVKGAANAKVTIVEYSDYQCPFCARHVRDTLGQIQKEYIDTGKVKYAFKNLPLESIHPMAFKAAEAALCAGDQNKYWEMHDRLFANQAALAPDALVSHARTLGLDAGAFQQCLTSSRHAARIRQEMSDAQGLRVSGTPGFFIGLTVPGDPNVKTVRFLNGAQSFAAFKSAIDTLLTAQ